jgi:hypothetical protein
MDYITILPESGCTSQNRDVANCKSKIAGVPLRQKTDFSWRAYSSCPSLSEHRLRVYLSSRGSEAIPKPRGEAAIALSGAEAPK